jgi:hypothetical protein
VVADETEFGLRELDSRDRHLVGFEFWRASTTLPRDLLGMLRHRRPTSRADRFFS